LTPFTIIEESGRDDIDAISEKLARMFNVKYILKLKSDRPTLEREAGKLGIPAVVSEAGSLGTFDETDIKVHVTGTINVMKHLKMLNDTPNVTVEPEVIIDGYKINATKGGLFYPKVKAGKTVLDGEVLGEIKDIKGDLVERIVALKGGVVLYMFFRHVVNTGDPLFSIGIIER